MLNSDKIRELRMGTIKDIKANRDLTLYCDVKQKFEMKCPKDFYERCLAYIKANKRVFDDKDYKIMKLRYGEAKSTKNIGDIIGFSEPSICYRIKNSLYKLKRNIKRISESSIYENEKPVENQPNGNFDLGYWNGERISKMHYNHLVNALEYATQTKQHDKVKELTAEIRKREGFQDNNAHDTSLLGMAKAYADLMAKLKKQRETLEKTEKLVREFENFFEQEDKLGRSDDLSIK